MGLRSLACNIPASAFCWANTAKFTDSLEQTNLFFDGSGGHFHLFCKCFGGQCWLYFEKFKDFLRTFLLCENAGQNKCDADGTGTRSKLRSGKSCVLHQFDDLQGAAPPRRFFPFAQRVTRRWNSCFL